MKYFKDKEEKEEEISPEEAARKKKVLIVSIASIAGTLALGWLVWFLFFSSQFVTFRENTYHMSIKYPRGWTVAPGYAGTVVAFASPKEDALDTFQENLNVAVKDLSQAPMTLDEYTKLAIKQMAAVF